MPFSMCKSKNTLQNSITPPDLLQITSNFDGDRRTNHKLSLKISTQNYFFPKIYAPFSVQI